MSYHDDLFPMGIAYGARGGPEFNTTILELASGFEKRNINWSKARAKYNVMHGVKVPADMDRLLNFFNARFGRAYSFPFFDHKDHKIVNQVVGTGNGIAKVFQIYKRYQSGIYYYDRLITKIKPNTIGNVMVGSITYVKDGPGADGYKIDLLTGKLTFNVAPAINQPVIITYVEFYVHVRFDVDFMDIQLVTFNAETWADIFIVEVKEDILP